MQLHHSLFTIHRPYSDRLFIRRWVNDFVEFLNKFVKTIYYTQLEDSAAEWLFDEDLKEHIIASRLISMRSTNIL
jgi:hypothetical protein